MINRSLITVKAQEPFRQWLLNLPDPCNAFLDEINLDSTAYLLPEFEDDTQRDRTFKKFSPLIFEAKLDGWWTWEEDWPAKRDLSTFKKWFDWEFHSVVEDLVGAPLNDD